MWCCFVFIERLWEASAQCVLTIVTNYRVAALKHVGDIPCGRRQTSGSQSFFLAAASLAYVAYILMIFPAPLLLAISWENSHQSPLVQQPSRKNLHIGFPAASYCLSAS